MRTIGIDPGLDGAFAVVDDGEFVAFEDTPTLTLKRGKKNRRKYQAAEMAQRLGQYLYATDKKTGVPKRVDVTVILEEVHAMPRQGVTSQFSLGVGLGLWMGIVAGLGIPLATATPQQWKRSMGLGKDKAESRYRAMQMFPKAAKGLSRVRDHGRAEALLLAVWYQKTLTTSG